MNYILGVITFLQGGIRRTKRLLYYLWRKPKFKSYYFSDTILRPIKITPQFIELGERVIIWYHARIQGVKKYNGTIYQPRIILHNGVSIQQNIHLTCANLVEVGDNTAIAANVTITDIHHPYTDIEIPIERQDLVVKSVVIGKDCKIYNNVVILPGTIIGNHVTIGANSVVSGVFPDNCVVIGAPAYIIKRYDNETGKWRKTDKKGLYV